MTSLPTVPDRAPLIAAHLTPVLEGMPDPGGGRTVAELEHEIAAALNIEHVVAVSSGTAALQAALSALGVGPGDEVLVPALSVVMTVAPLVALGARPVFVDSDPAGLDLDHDDAARKVTSRTRAIMPVHLWGRMGDPVALTAFASAHGLAVIEDAAQAIGTVRDRRDAGTVGTVGCFSMKDGKVVWSGEGGFLVTRSPEVAEHARAWRGHWQPPPKGQAPQSRLATNSRLAAPLAAIARANLDLLDPLVELRRAQTHRLLHALGRTPGVRPLLPAPGEEWNGYAPLLRLDLPRPRAFAEHLAVRGVPNSTGTFRLVPCDLRPMFTDPPTAPCRGAAEILDRTLAVVVTEADTVAVLDHYTDVITREAAAWTA
ncbi:DegT/DnrJ/EryC1/StrS aminotransferase family protein [Nocardiopsis sp. MG754419]|uniref:DegT/DnrJ/EryC1/StrS family aminotransferase n=1 Tax=Nocardiopsis sp. MG754419 TaxID=2259865 RepID=UPI001BA9CF76|nr:DegT/DnrJ/EryC1/StrS family aminotransferase [Nocardiopsis sp. MG754419]MBR8742582.1 aminotransferase [Nocardiopsis sp. MG754419]